MRLCRYDDHGTPRTAFYSEDGLIPLTGAAVQTRLPIYTGDCLLPLLPGGEYRQEAIKLAQAVMSMSSEQRGPLMLPLKTTQLLVPSPQPSKLLLLAGNYSAHIEEGGGRAEERARTFPYVFMKPPQTTLTHPGKPVRIPKVSPNHVDWELELGVIIGKTCHGVSEADALKYVAGYTVVNDISDRKFKPNPGRAQREKDGFFDWLHGKWHDTFCPMGPCVLPADELTDPQTLKLELKLNGNVEQDSSTAEMVFPVAAIVSFISSFVTLEPGDVISTGTPAGVGSAKGKFLKPGDRLEATIEKIGTLYNPVE